MIITIVHFEDGIWDTLNDESRFVERVFQTLRDLGTDVIRVVDLRSAGSFQHTTNLCEVEYHSTLESALTACDGDTPRVFLCAPNEQPNGRAPTSISEFTHPEGDVVYVIGANYEPMDIDGAVREMDHTVHIPTQTKYKMLWALPAATIVMYDRLVQ